jgi:hypothetical protein
MRVLSKAPTFGLLLLGIAAPRAVAADGLTDSYCFLDHQSSDATVWNVNARFTDYLNTAGNLTSSAPVSDADARAVVDIALQNLTRQSRATIHARVNDTASTCDTGNSNCITAKSNLEDFTCLTQSYNAYTNSNNSIVFCLDRNISPGLVAPLVEHELGHAYSLAHVNDAYADVCAATPNGFCDGGVTDGCEGELMCRAQGCTGTGPGIAAGDALGLRVTYNNASGDYVPRFVNTGRSLLPGQGSFQFQTPAILSGGLDSAHAPRIDCARGSNPLHKCVVVRTYPSTGISERITTLDDWDALQGWVTAQNIYSVGSSTSFTMPPDISLTNGGGSAWTTRVTDSATDNVQIRFVNLTSLNTYTALLGYRTRLPPRIVSYGTDIALVVGVDTATGRWRLNRIRFSTSTRPNLSVDSIDFGVLGNQGSTDNFHNHIVSDFDFDCDRSGNGAQCVIAAALLEEDIGPLFGGANFSTVQTSPPDPKFVGGSRRRSA